MGKHSPPRTARGTEHIKVGRIGVSRHEARGGFGLPCEGLGGAPGGGDRCRHVASMAGSLTLRRAQRALAEKTRRPPVPSQAEILWCKPLEPILQHQTTPYTRSERGTHASNELGRFPFLSNLLARVFPHLSALIFLPTFPKTPNYGLPPSEKKKHAHNSPSHPHLFALIFPPKFPKIPNYGLPRVGKKKVMLTLTTPSLTKTQIILVVKIVYNLSTILTA